ncbi:ABC transporter permease [Flavimobilis marinus]|nr:ABC-2 family transporter protein [Flavimobilis marinus]
MLYYLWQAVFDHRPSVGSYDFQQMAGYVVLSSLILQYNSFGAGRQLSLMVARGDIAVEMVRPYSLVGRLLAQDVGIKIVELTKSGLALLAVGLVLADETFAAGIATWLLFIAAVLIGGTAIQLVDIVIGSVAFWTNNTWGLWLVRNSVVALFSGALLPLSFFPGWFQSLSSWLPFSVSLYVPIDLFISEVDLAEWLSLFARGVIWLAAGALAAVFVVNRAVQRVEVFGG